MVFGSLGILVGRAMYRKPRVRPTLEEIATYLGGVTELEEYEAMKRRNERMLRDGNRTHLPYPNEGPPARISKMRVVKPERRQ
jgi:hypothetical protein